MGRFPNKYVIGLTGNIATGKSVVRQMLQHLGAYTIDADSLAHQVMMPGAPAYKPIIATFGQIIVGADGRIDRSVLGKMVFGNPAALKKLEDITHPVIRQGIMALINRAQQRVVVIEAIKLLDGDLAGMVDAVWVVDASPLTQYKRLIEKRKMSEADAKQRIQAQGPQAEKLKRANVIIKNDTNVDETWKQVQAQWNEIRRQLAGGAPATPAASAPAPATPAPKPPTPAASAPATPAPAAPAPAPAQASSDTRPLDDGMGGAAAIDVSGISVKRGMPGNAQDIADFISSVTGKSISRIDIMMAFGQKSFLVAENKEGKIMGVVGWTVENLVTRMDEFYVGAGVPINTIVHAIVVAVESASKDLQSEVAFFFLPSDMNPQIISAFKSDGYNNITLPEIKIPAWREAVEETIRGKQFVVLWKQLRQDRVLQPI